ncbi:bifunctional hydroxymethylpyrimidine kinase/phosphomethylpyrimidine kinase [Deinococcus maricopensis]|uniref:hydroxymethylpyrimidine kinase n=1 Tax=Deinococcus maricopensis (strain DSM 21211 / LMG 22137 / NRRL B-23946 / LB-34) TaxID=709986 RepID=E8U9W5_DEIML|nr:bifunctional hydroxymethylpyrimidine kinase/phosphomethylpyrimidine kinase [Deinococcus maricopensis]ADV67854.1 phosphomethylpyrimidine kinase [Deinococcus maricopensis DSM 21211]
MTPVALSVAGWDSGGGAGVGADLQVFRAHGVHGVGAVTLVTAQNTLGVQAVQVMDPALVRAQLESVLSDFPVGAVKVGALGSAGVVRAVAEVLRAVRVPVVVDPVLVSTSGRALLAPDALEVFRRELLPLAALVTPNLPEAEVLLGWPAGALSGGLPVEWAAPWPALVKGGHGLGDVLVDVLALHGMRRALTAARRESRHTHGTGCALSSAVAARLACGEGLVEAVTGAHAYVQAALAGAPGLGAGHGPLGVPVVGVGAPS